jgi:hypothetical protein
MRSSLAKMNDKSANHFCFIAGVTSVLNSSSTHLNFNYSLLFSEKLQFCFEKRDIESHYCWLGTFCLTELR